jgi:hypothetical protein
MITLNSPLRDRQAGSSQPSDDRVSHYSRMSAYHPTLPFLGAKMDGGYRRITRRRRRIRTGLSGREDPLRRGAFPKMRDEKVECPLGKQSDWSAIYAREVSVIGNRGVNA